MSLTKYHYNPKTCQYDRARLSLVDVIMYGSGLILTGALIFVALLALQSVLVKSDKEVALRNENAILEKHQTLLTAQLNEVDASLAQLQSKEHELTTRLFDTGTPDQPAGDNTVTQKSEILFANEDSFRKIVESLKVKSSQLAEKSAATNAYFGDHLQLLREDVKLLQQLPSLLPIDNQFEDQLASGFGTRVNPFHKGLYQHTGVDFVAPRGTEVVATGRGKVVEVTRSNLEAGYGNYVEIDHGHGFRTRYAHLEEITVKEGQLIEKGLPIATVGNSGGSIAPHLHYEVIRDGENNDPVNFMIEGLTSAEYKLLSTRSKKQNQSLD